MAKDTKIVREPVEKPAPSLATPSGGERSFTVRVRTLLVDAILDVKAASAEAAKDRIVRDFAAGVTVEE